MAETINRTGEKVNSWTFLEYKGMNKWGEATWLCRCDCGYEKIQVAGNVKSGGSRMCRTCSQMSKPYSGGIPEVMWKRIVRNSDKRNILISVTKDEAYELFVKQKGVCVLSGLLIKFATNCKEYVNKEQTASLDRIDSKIGYVKGNIQWVHKKINIMKNVLSQDEFVELCKLIAYGN